MAEKPEAGSAERSKSVSLPSRESYPLKEVVAAWKDYLDEERIVEYIKLGKLTCGVLLGDRLVKVIRPSFSGAPSFRVRSEFIMTTLLFAAVTFLSTLLGGLFALRFRDRLHCGQG
jgi:hypothetical protein